MFKNKNYVKSRFAVLATGVFLSMLITAPQSQAAYKISLSCNAVTDFATVSKPSQVMISYGYVEYRLFNSQKFNFSTATANIDNGVFSFPITNETKYVSVYPDSRGGYSGLVACR